MSSFEITGKLHVKGETQQVTDSFTKRELVITMQDGKYEQFIAMELLQDRCSLLDQFNVGDEVKVSFNLRGREWNGKYFTNLAAWRIEKAATQNATPPVESNNAPPTEKPSDLPF